MNAIGTLAWSRRTGGYLTTSDHLTLAVQALFHRLARQPVRQRQLSTATETAPEIPALPDTPVARLAREQAALANPRWLYRHSLRTYLWARLLGQMRGIACDDELLFVASLFHDRALAEPAPALCTPRACFAVESADAAARFVRELGWDSARRHRLQEAISLHLNLRVPLAQGAEAHLLHAGAALDCTGCGLDEIPPPLAAAVLAAYPRDGFKAHMRATLGVQTRRRFGSRTAVLARLGLDRLILAAPFAE